jgi:hypothetical protein
MSRMRRKGNAPASIGQAVAWGARSNFFKRHAFFPEERSEEQTSNRAKISQSEKER